MGHFDYVYKIILVGDSGGGKTNLINRLIEDKFTSENKTTIGMDFHVKPFNVGTDIIKIQFWDTAGQERFRSIIRSYYRLAASVIIVFDLTRRSTFESIDRWINELRDNIHYNIEDVELLLVGNKCDLAGREVTKEEIEKVCEKYNLTYVETSAKDNINIQESFQELAERVHDHGYYIYGKESDDIIQVIDTDDGIEKQGCCYTF
jgi:small GTP-binding protein